MPPAPSETDPPLAPGRRRWTARAAFARAIAVLLEEGPRSLWFKVLGETVYRRLLLAEAPLAELLEPRPAAVPLAFAFLAPAEAGEYAALRPDATATQALTRVRRGERCFVARHEGRLISARWISEREAFVEYLGCRIALADGVVYLYESYVVPEYRGLGVAPACAHELARRLATAGYATLLGAFLPENRPIRRAYAKAGYDPVGRIGYAKLGPWRRDFLRLKTSASARLLG